MRLSAEKLANLAKKRGIRVSELLRRAGVSRTAYYALARKDELLPKSLESIAAVLGVSPLKFIEEGSRQESRTRFLLRQVDVILKGHPDADRDNVWHTLLLLEEKPIERLRRGLRRAQRIDLQ